MVIIDVKGIVMVRGILSKFPIEDVTRTVKNIAGAEYALVTWDGTTATYKTASDYGEVDCRAVRNGLVAVLSTKDYKDEHPSAGIELFVVTYSDGHPKAPLHVNIVAREGNSWGLDDE